MFGEEVEWSQVVENKSPVSGCVYFEIVGLGR
jgi:hypothetical protein